MGKTTTIPARIRQVREQLDVLIDWYERFRPEAGRTIQVALTRADALRFAQQEGDAVLYRSRRLDCIGKEAKR